MATTRVLRRSLLEHVILIFVGLGGLWPNPAPGGPFRSPFQVPYNCPSRYRQPDNMPRISFFISFEGRAANDNRERLPRAFSKSGWDVVSVDHESLALEDRRLTGMTGTGERIDVGDSCLYFILGFGASHTFLDRMQMLAALEKARFVNTPESLILDHGKISLYLNHPEVEQPESYLANDPAVFTALVESGGDWIAKPPAGSFGRDVYLLHAMDTNLRPILESLTQDGRYAMLQRYVQPTNGEKRVLAAGVRIPVETDHPFQSKPITDSIPSRSPIPVDADH